MSTKALTPAKQGKASTPSFTPAATGLLQRACACGGPSGVDGSCTECKGKRLTGEQRPLVQAKLNVSRPGDRYEQEADRIADQVMRMPAPQVQRQAMPEEEEEDETLQMKPLSTQITPLVQRETIDEEEDKEEDVPVHMGSIGITGLPSAPSEGSDARGYTGPTAVVPGPTNLSQTNVKPDAETLNQWRLEGLMLGKRPEQMSIWNLPREAAREKLDKSLEGIALKWGMNPVLLKKVVRSGLKGLGKKALEAAMKEIAPDPNVEEGLKKDLDDLWKERQELEKKINIGGGKKGEALQRQALTEEKEDEEELLQAKRADAQAPAVTSSTEAAIRSVRQGGGKPLDAATRAFMEPRFGHDFSQVRVHTDSRAAAAARAVNARAFTVGHDIVLGAGQYAPETTAGQRLLAHELTHVAQQSTAFAPAMIRRAPTDDHATEATGDADVAESRVWEQLVADFFSYVVGMAEVNQPYRTDTRARWGAAFQELWATAGAPGERTNAELLEVRRAFEELEDLFVDENTAAIDVWLDLMHSYEEERADLVASDFIEDVAALEILEELFKKTEKRVELTDEYLVLEDLVALHYMLENQTHITRGMKVAEWEMERRRSLEKEFAEEEDKEGPSALGVAWDIVGWDSAGDFALDVWLTLVTGALGKVTKVLVKGRKAKKKLEKVKKLAKLRKLRKAKRLERLLEGATKLVRSVAEALESFEAPSYLDWIKKNWRKTLISYATDELSVVVSGGDAAEVHNLLETLSREKVQDYVSHLIGISPDDEKAQFRAAVVAYAAGPSGGGMKEFRRYLAMNLKRRGLSNAVYFGARLGVGETKLGREVAVDVAVSTAGQMAQDLVVNLVPGVPKPLVEMAQKTVQNTVATSIKDALT